MMDRASTGSRVFPAPGGDDRFMAALVAQIVGLDPESESLPPDVLAIVRRAIAKRPAPLRRQVWLFLALLRWLPAFRYGASFDRLAVRQQRAVLTWFQSAPVSLLRKGFWGIKNLVYMGFYGRPGGGPDLGYRPAPDGNGLLRA